MSIYNQYHIKLQKYDCSHFTIGLIAL